MQALTLKIDDILIERVDTFNFLELALGTTRNLNWRKYGRAYYKLLVDEL